MSYQYLKFFDKAGSPFNFTYGTMISGPLLVGSTYTLTDFAVGDDFSNVGARNISGNMFVATGTTPNAWTNGSTLTNSGYWTGTVYMSKTSVGLYENAHLFILEEVLTGSPETPAYTFPLLGNQFAPATSQSWQTGWFSNESQYNIFTYGITHQNNIPYITSYNNISISDPTVPYTNNTAQQKIVSTVNTVPMQLNIAFTSAYEDIYERTLLIMDMSQSPPVTVAVIGFYGETVGEDERLKTTLENFGRAFTEKDAYIIRDYNIDEALPDWQQINEKRKEMLLAGEDIFPYIGGYRAFINIINFFGYQDLVVKEYWLNVDAKSENFGKISQWKIEGMLTETTDATVVNPLRNSTSYRKTGMFGLFYDITIASGDVDQYGTPITINASQFTPEEVLIKLFALKNKLTQYYMPINARIVDITGEGIYFDTIATKVWTDTVNVESLDLAGVVNFKVSQPSGVLGYVDDLRQFQIQPFPNGLDLPVQKFTNTVNPYSSGQDYPASSVPGLIASIEQFYLDRSAFTFPYQDYKPNHVGDEPGIIAGCPIILSAELDEFTWDDLNVSWDSTGTTTISTLTTSTFRQPETINQALGGVLANVTVSVVTTALMQASIAKVVTVTLTGTGVGNNPGANITVGNLIKPATFNTDLTTTCSNFVASWAAEYLNYGLIVTSSTNTLIFTSHYKGWDFNVGSTKSAGILFNVTNPGAGYINGVHFGVNFSGGSGVGLQATVTVLGGIITAILITDQGLGYQDGDALTLMTTNDLGVPSTLGTIQLNILTGTNVVTTVPVSNILYINFGGYYQISSVPSTTTVVLTNLGYDSNVAVGATVPIPLLTIPLSLDKNYNVFGPSSVVTPGIYTWDTINFANYYDIQWTIEKIDVQPYYFQFRGSIYDYHDLPHFLPYTGEYRVIMEVFDLFNSKSVRNIPRVIEVLSNQVEIGAFARWRDYETYAWDTVDNLTWDELAGSSWNNISAGNSNMSSPLNENILSWPRYVNQANAQILSPYTGVYEDLMVVQGESISWDNPARRFGTVNLTWENMNVSWDELAHSTWNYYDYHAEFLGGFKIYNPEIGDTIQIDDYPQFQFYDLSPSIAPLSLAEAVIQLNSTFNEGIRKFNWHVFQIPESPPYIVASGKFPGPDSWHFVQYTQANSPGGITGDPNSWKYPSWIQNQNALTDLITRYPAIFADRSLLFLDVPLKDLKTNAADNYLYWKLPSEGGVAGDVTTESPTNPLYPDPFNHRGHLSSWNGSGAFTNGDVKIFGSNSFNLPLGVPLFLVHGQSSVPGMTASRWVITNEITGEVVIDVKHPFVIINFNVESVYTVELWLTDSNNNPAYVKKQGYITVTSFANINNNFINLNAGKSTINTGSGLSTINS